LYAYAADAYLTNYYTRPTAVTYTYIYTWRVVMADYDKFIFVQLMWPLSGGNTDV